MIARQQASSRPGSRTAAASPAAVRQRRSAPIRRRAAAPAVVCSAAPAAASSSTANTAEVDAALAALLELKRAGAPQGEIDAALEAAKALSAGAGLARVEAAWNDGTFEGTTLAGRMVSLLGGEKPIPFQMLSFGCGVR